MMALRMLVLSFLIGAAGACGDGGTIDGPIGYRSTGGFSGRGDGTPALHIDLDGTVTREKAVGGTESAMLDRATLDDLHRKILEADFAELEPTYDCQCEDDYVYVVTVQLDGTLYTVMADSLAPPPAPLLTVIDALRAIGALPLDWR